MATSSSNEKLTREMVKKVSTLSRLQLSDDELSAIQNQLSAVLENFEQISQVDTKGVQPLLSPTEISQNLRKDEVVPFDSEKVLMNAPEKSGRLFKVPPVV